MKSSKTIFLAGLFFSMQLFLSCSEDRVYDKPTQLITTDLAQELNSNYNIALLRSRATVTDSVREDANAVWYSIEELERYINYVKTEGINKGYDVDGIRLYLGKYPSDPNKYNEKAGMTTVFLSPTGTKKATQKASVLTISTTTMQEQTHKDITELSPMNYGSMGNPPKVIYPSN